MNMKKRFLAGTGVCLLWLSASSARADVLLTFSVTNVQQNGCAGPIQPGCFVFTVPQSSFMQTVRFNPGGLLGALGSGVGPVLQSQAFYALPDTFSLSPYTYSLQQWLNGPITTRTRFVELDSSYDADATAGSSSALLLNDMLSDVTDATGFRSQQEYKHGLTLSTGLFDNAGYYTDLANESLGQFFRKYIGKMTGSFDELGSTSRFDPNTLALDPYMFSEYTGDATLFAVEELPEPSTLALVAIAGLAFVSTLLRTKR
jgi:hypothetical protein